MHVRWGAAIRVLGVVTTRLGSRLNGNGNLNDIFNDIFNDCLSSRRLLVPLLLCEDRAVGRMPLDFTSLRVGHPLALFVVGFVEAINRFCLAANVDAHASEARPCRRRRCIPA